MKKKFALLLFLCCYTALQSHIIFIHIPKCAGSSTNGMLRSSFPNKNQILKPHYIPGLLRGGIEKKNSGAEQRLLKKYPIDSQCKLISGHFPVWFLKRNYTHYKSAFKFTVLREPIERVLSHYRYRHQRKAQHHSSHTPLGIKPNFMCKMLATDYCAEGEELLNQAIETLNELDEVLFVDDFHESIVSLFQTLNLPLTKVVHVNKSTPMHINPKYMDAIRKNNALDIRLYEYAVKHFKKPKKSSLKTQLKRGVF